jgi:signal transduction histidine kinase
LIVVVVAIRGWLGVPGTLVLLSVSTGAAVAMLGPAAAVLAAVGESGLLLLLSHAAKAAVPSTTDVPSALRAGLASVDGTEISVALVVVWSSLAVAYAVYYPLSQLNRRLWESLRQARGRMDESLDRKVELAQALEDLGNANRQLALANERSAALRTVAEEAQRSKAAFVARVSHEFRTPLNMIIGLVGIMVENPEMYAEELPPDLWADLEIVYRNCQHLSGMINDVLDLTQAEAGRLVLHKEQVDLGAIVESAIAVVWPMIDKKRLALQVSVPDDLPQVYCDPNRVRQVLLNLLSNAARFTAQGGIRSCGPT